MKHLIKRILNGLYLEYSFQEILKFILFRSVICLFNSYKQISVMSWTSLNFKDVTFLVISLKKREDRRQHIEKQFLKLSLPFKFIDAIDGKKLDKINLTKRFSVNSLDSLTKGSLGCINSHIKTYQYIIENEIPYAVIFEDDINLNKDFKTLFSYLLNSVPSSFDLIYLASNYSQRNNTSGSVSNTLYIPFYPRSGQYAYLISNKGAKKILKEIYPIKIVLGGIDTIIGRLISKKKLNSFHSRNNLCTVDYNNESDIENYSRPQKKLYKN